MMKKYVLAIDLGTGGCRSSLYDENGQSIGSVFEQIETRYHQNDFHEQRPDDWVVAVISSIKKLLAFAFEENNISSKEIVCIGIGGHSLGTVPLDCHGNLLLEWTPIWSDGRAENQAKKFFTKMEEDDWYSRTGCGFPVANYPLFKISWFQDHFPDLFGKIDKVLGTKDYVNFRLTGKMATDFSYASGYGVWNLVQNCFDQDILNCAGLSASLFPEVRLATDCIGTLLPEIANELGLIPETKVIVGGIDNSCIALGALCNQVGQCAGSLGSSSWLTVCSDKPLIDTKDRPFIFNHLIPGYYLNFKGVFSTGTTMRWLRDTLCQNIKQQALETGRNPYFLMQEAASLSSIGANQLIMNPCFIGSASSKSQRNIRGAFWGLSLSHTQGDIIRATLEGIAMSLREAWNQLSSLISIENPIHLVGDPLTNLSRYMYANILAHSICTTSKSQSVPALGVAALALVGSDIWSDFSPLNSIDQDSKMITEPDNVCVAKYERVFYVYQKTIPFLQKIAQCWDEDIFLIDESN
ncbi:MAG: FGGY family carbohydrate kinase [Planctomycetia bacterium]|nr:FGGY family carbohydrate kinase [Planctomycetia bacterium]